MAKDGSKTGTGQMNISAVCVFMYLEVCKGSNKNGYLMEFGLRAPH